MLGGMAQCSICAYGETVRETVDAMLDEKCFLDDIAAKVNLLLAERAPGLSIHRSSIHRHAKKCYTLRERAARLKERESVSRNDRRIFVQWPEHLLFGELAGKTTSDEDAIAPGQLRSRDVLLTITFEERGQKPAHPVTLKPEEPPEGKETMPEEKQSEDGLFTRLARLLTFGDKPAEQPPALEPLPEVETLEQVQSKCEHDFKPIPTGSRCQACGLQTNSPVVPGISRADYFAARRRF